MAPPPPPEEAAAGAAAATAAGAAAKTAAGAAAKTADGAAENTAAEAGVSKDEAAARNICAPYFLSSLTLYSLIMSLSTIIVKYLLDFADFWSVFSYVRLGLIFPLIPALYYGCRDFRLTIKKHGAKVLGWMTLGESLNVAAVLLFTVAMSVGFVTLANALSSVQPFFVFLFALLISLFYPQILKEEIGKRTLLLKLLAIVMIFAGVLLIT